LAMEAAGEAASSQTKGSPKGSPFLLARGPLDAQRSVAQAIDLQPPQMLWVLNVRA